MNALNLGLLRRHIYDARFALEEIRDMIKKYPDLPHFDDAIFNLSHLTQWVKEQNAVFNPLSSYAPTSDPRTLSGTQTQENESETPPPHV